MGGRENDNGMGHVLNSLSLPSLSLCFCLVDPIPNLVFGTKKTDSAMFLYFYMYVCVCVLCVYVSAG